MPTRQGECPFVQRPEGAGRRGQQVVVEDLVTKTSKLTRFNYRLVTALRMPSMPFRN